MKKSHMDYLRKVVEVSVKARESGNTPFGAYWWTRIEILSKNKVMWK